MSPENSPTNPDSIPARTPPLLLTEADVPDVSGTLWIVVARLLRPQGRRGEVLAEPLTDLDGVFTAGRNFRVAPSTHAVSSSAGTLRLEDCWHPTGRNAGRLVLKLAGIDTISAAESLEDAQLFLPEAELPALPEDTYLVRDLVGCTLYDREDLLGTITDLQFPVGPDGRTRLPEAVDLLVLEPANPSPPDDPILIPFVKAWLDAIDLPNKRITMHLPPGLTGSTTPGKDEAESEMG